MTMRERWSCFFFFLTKARLAFVRSSRRRKKGIEMLFFFPSFFSLLRLRVVISRSSLLSDLSASTINAVSVTLFEPNGKQQNRQKNSERTWPRRWEGTARGTTPRRRGSCSPPTPQPQPTSTRTWREPRTWPGRPGRGTRPRRRSGAS